MTIGEFLSRLNGVKAQGKGWIAQCPAHDDRKASLSVREGDDNRILLKCHAGCETDAIVGALGLTMADLFAEPAKQKPVIEATYDYRDEGGKFLFQTVKYTPKDFRQRRPACAGGWIWNMDGVRRVLYRLPELLAADYSATVFIPEGEKDVDRLRAGGLVATCNPMGAGSAKNNFNWRDEYNEALAGRNVVIIPDNDQAGRDHAQAIARSLQGVAATVKMLTLSGLPDKGDVSNWLSLGGAIETLRALADAAPEWKPDAESSTETNAKQIAISWGALCEMKLERRETILHEVERGEIVMCPAITNRGKTTLWRNIALSLACGRGYAPIVPVGPPRSVLYLDFETRLYRAQSDITKMLGALTQPERALVAQNLHIIADCRIDGRPLTLSNPRHLELVEREAERVKADVIIADTLTAAFEIADENSNAEAAKVMKILTAMALRLNCVIVFLHHVGKAKLEEGQTAQAVHRARGASAYAGFSHAIFSLLPDATVQERNTLECSKVKGERFDDTVLKLDTVTRWFTAAGAVEKPTSTYDQVIGIFNGHALKRADVIARFPNLSKETVDKYLKQATALGDLIQGKEGKATTYQKPEKPNVRNVRTPYREPERYERSEPFDGVEDSGNLWGEGENGERGNDRGQPYDLSPWLGTSPEGRHPDDYDDCDEKIRTSKGF